MKLETKRLTAEESREEATRFFHNALEKLRQTPRKDGFYADVKPVQEACGVAYLAMLYAVQGFLLDHGVLYDKLPGSREALLAALKRYSARNGKVIVHFEGAYEGIHLWGYYKGMRKVEALRAYFDSARFVIEKLGGRKVG